MAGSSVSEKDTETTEFTGVRSHHPEVQKELARQIELVKANSCHGVSALLENAAQLCQTQEDFAGAGSRYFRLLGGIGEPAGRKIIQ